MEIKLRINYSEEFIIELPEQGLLTSEIIDGKTFLIVDGVQKDDITSLGNGYNKLQCVCSELLKLGYYVTEGKYGYTYVMNSKYKEILDKIKNINDHTLYRFDFGGFVSINRDNILSVVFRGHVVGGSYVHEWKVYPYYVKALEQASLRRTSFRNYGRTLYGYDCYTFDIDLDEELTENTLDIALIAREKHLLYFLGFKKESQIGNSTYQYSWIDDTDVPEEYKDLSIYFKDVDTTFYSAGNYDSFEGCKEEDVIDKLLYLKDFIEFLKSKNLLKLNTTPISDFIGNGKELTYYTCSWKSWLLNPNKVWFDSVEQNQRGDWFSESTRKRLEEIKENFVKDEYPGYLKETDKFMDQFMEKYGVYFN